MGVLRLGELCFSDVEWIFIYFLLFHHGRHGHFVLIEGYAMEVAGLALILSILLNDYLAKFVKRNQVFLFDQFIENVNYELLLFYICAID